MREAWTRHLHWVSAGRVGIPQPAGGRVADADAGLRQMWEEVPETEEAASQIRVRWRRPAESPKKPDVSEPIRTDRQPFSLPHQGPYPGTAVAGRARRRRDAASRPPLRHRKWPQRL